QLLDRRKLCFRILRVERNRAVIGPIQDGQGGTVFSVACAHGRVLLGGGQLVRAPKPSSVPELRLFCERPRRSPLSTKDARCGESREHTSIRPVPCPFQHGRGSGTLVRCCHSNGDAACVLSLEPKVGQKF